MITMKNFRVLVPEKKDALLGYTGENLSRRLTIAVDDPGPWSYKLDIRNDAGVANIMDMAAGDGVIYVDIERAALQVSGRVQAQVRAIAGDAVKCSNIFSLFIGDSVQAVNYFESLPPSEFEQLEANLTAIKSEAQASARKAKESENNAKAYAEGGMVQNTTYDESGHLAGITATEVTGAKGYQSKAAENAASARKLMLRAKAYAEGGAVEQEPIGNALYPSVDTIGAKGDMEQAQEAADRAEGAAERAEAAGGSGSGGGEGTPGGYYTPTVSQPDATTMRVSYTPAQAGMAGVAQVDGVLPKGDSGKTAYESAVEAGYTGSESEFAAKLAAEHLPVPATAAVGQYFRAKTVDENGLVTEVEAADAPTGASGETWRKLCDVSVTSDTAPDGIYSVEISETEDGQVLSDLDLHEIAFGGWAIQKGSSTYSYGTFKINDLSISVGQNFGLAADARRFFSGNATLLGGGMLSAAFATSNILHASAFIGGIAMAGTAVDPKYVTDIGSTIDKISINHGSASGLFSEFRLVVYGR